MSKLFTVHFTLTETGESSSDTVTADTPKEAQRLVRRAYNNRPMGVTKVKLVRSKSSKSKRS